MPTANGRRPDYGLPAGAAALAALLLCAPAAAQEGTALNRFQPAPAGDRFLSVEDARVDGELAPAASLVFDYANAPLRLVETTGGSEQPVADLVAFQAHLHGLVSLAVLSRLKVELALPVTVAQGGDETNAAPVEPPSGASLGDLRGGLRVEVLEQRGAWPAAAISASVFAPTGDETAWAGADATRLAANVVVGADYEQFLWSARFGRTLDLSDSNDSLLRSELTAGVAAGPRIGPVMVAFELAGRTVADTGQSAFDKDTTSLEALITAALEAGPLVFRLGGGPGLSSGIGTPRYRLLAGVGASFDLAPSIGDDAHDNGDASGADGSALGSNVALDTDGDGVLDADDHCPTIVGVAHGARPGCPSDIDADGVADRRDACPEVFGAASNDPAKDGCPPDKDADGILDSEDACPMEPGPVSSTPERHGCPEGVATVRGEQIVIQESVEFENASSTILPASEQALQGVATVLKNHPEIVRLAIEGHTDSNGREEVNIALSQRRALAVMQWLIEHGIDERRLESRGFGPRQPIADNETEEGRAQNRRVDFRIVHRDESGEAAWTDGPVKQ